MFHVGLRENPNSEVDYAKLTPKLLLDPSQVPLLPPPTIPHMDKNTVELPKAPEGFSYHRVETGDTLISLSVKYNISVNRLRSFNSRACFDHRLAHIRGQLLLIPSTLQSKLTPEILNELNEQNDNLLQNSIDPNHENKEPDENGKYQLRKAFQFYTKIDSDRANYYLGESNWHLRNAINLYQTDSKWEKQDRLSKLISCTFDEAKSLLEVHHWNVDEAYRYWLDHGNNKNINKKKNIENNTKEQELTSMNNEGQPEFSHSDNTPMQRGICC